MKTLKCRICGGDIVPRGETGVCDSCGAVVSLVSVSDDIRIESMNRANEARRTHDYDEAVRAWSKLAAEDPSNAEARWNLALSRYGVDYVWDELTADFLPTINRLRYDRFTDDPDYQAAVMNADENAIVYYMEEAKRIQSIQDRLLELIRTEPDYDVFISFKAEDAAGRRTRDSVLAQEIYEQLTAKGLRVFYSRISLQNVSGQEFEPHIFAALHSARIMILVGTRLDYLTAPWVKNEWSRFLALMDGDQDRYLIPAYESMAPEFFPAEIPMREALDMSTPGAMLDLTQGVLKLLGRENTAASREEYNRLVERMKGSLAEGDFAQVRALGDQAVQADPAGAEAWWMLLLAENGLTDESGLLTARINWMDSRYFNQAYNLAGSRRRKLLEEVRQNYETYLEERSKEARLASEAQISARQASQAVEQARALMMAGKYKEAGELLASSPAMSEEARELREDAELGLEYGKIDTESWLWDEAVRRYPNLRETLKEYCHTPYSRQSGLPGSALKRVVAAGMTVGGALIARLLAAQGGMIGTLSLIVFIIGLMLLASCVMELVGNSTTKKVVTFGFPFVGAILWDMLRYELPRVIRNALPFLLLAAVTAFGAVSVRDLLIEGRNDAVRKHRGEIYDRKMKAAAEELKKEYQERFAPLAKYGPLKTLNNDPAGTWERIRNREL